MNQFVHPSSPAVRDFRKPHEFYIQTLGWHPAGAGMEDAAFFQTSGVVSAIYPREEAAEDAWVLPRGSGFSGITLANNDAQGKPEADRVMADLKSKGGRIPKEPHKAFWDGCSSYFAGPGDYRGEVAYNPFLPFDENGSLRRA